MAALAAAEQQAGPGSVEYWWQVCRGAEVMQAFLATPEAEAWRAVERHPALLLPELVDAAERALGASRATAGLRQMQQALRGTPYFAPYHRLLAATLAGARGGAPRANLERALAVMSEVSAAAAAAERAADEETCRALRAALAALGAGGGAAVAVAPAAVAVAAPAAVAAEGSGPVAATAVAAEGSGPVAAPPAAPPADPTRSRLFLDEAELRGYRRGDDRRGAPGPYDRALATQGGVYAGSAEWLGGDDWPAHRVVETRWLFPSSQAARAYLESATTLAAAGEQLPPARAPALGDGAHAWASAPPGRGAPASEAPRQILLFRVGRVVAKLHVTEGPRAPLVFQRLTQEHVLPYAEAAARRARWALAQYWLTIARAAEAVTRFVQAPPRTAPALLAEYPILLLPELPAAMTALDPAQRAAAERLVALHGAWKNDWRAYRGALRALVRMLLDEPGGDPRVNADAALDLVITHRRLDSDFSWSALEAECRERARVTADGGRRAA